MYFKNKHKFTEVIFGDLHDINFNDRGTFSVEVAVGYEYSHDFEWSEAHYHDYQLGITRPLIPGHVLSVVERCIKAEAFSGVSLPCNSQWEFETAVRAIIESLRPDLAPFPHLKLTQVTVDAIDPPVCLKNAWQTLHG